MKIVLLGETSIESDVEFLLSDDGFDIPGFVDVWQKDKPAVQLHISELLPAVQALHDRYIKGLEKERLLK